MANGNLQPFVLIVGRFQPVLEGVRIIFALWPGILYYATQAPGQNQKKNKELKNWFLASVYYKRASM